MEDEYLIVPSGSPDSYCRLCLSEANVEALLVSESFSQPNQKLVDLIRRHVEIGLSASADSPCGICSTCRMMLEEFDRFRERCLRCDFVLTGIDRQNGLVQPFECSQCASKFRFKSEFEKHWKSFHDLYYRCHLCEATFSTENMLICHAKYHEECSEKDKETEMYHCSYCPRIYSSDKQLRFHVQMLHESQNAIDKVLFMRKRKPERPETSEPPAKVSINVGPQKESDPSEKPYECKTCQIRFHFIGSLSRHIHDKHNAKQKGQSKKKVSKVTPEAPVLIEKPIVANESIPEPIVNTFTTLEPTISMLDSDLPIVDDQHIAGTGPEETPVLYDPSLVPNASEYIQTPEQENLEYMQYRSEEHDPTIYPCLVVLERLDEKLIPPIPNLEIPLGKYYHSLQMHSTFVEDPIDADFMQNYPSHIRNIKKSVQCEICNAQVRNKVALHRHKLYKHNPGIYFPCPYCGKNFLDKGGLDRHLPTHTNEYPHVCDECPMGFTRVGLLKKHKQKYHGPGALPLKLHYCPYCSRAFNKLHLIKNHVSLQHQDQYIVND